MSLLRTLALLIVVLWPALPQLVFAEDTPPSGAILEEQLKAAWAAAAKTATRGPADIALLDQAHFSLTGDEAFVPAAEAEQIMEVLGNGRNPARYGLIVSRRPGDRWMIVVTWVKEGYVRDGDAKEWQADALLDGLREGTEKGDTERLARGLPALDVVGWIEPPAYDGTAHRLVWSVLLHERNAPADRPQLINYNTYALGRDGFFSLNLVTNSTSIERDKHVVRALLSTLVYVPGKRYEDFDQSTDKVAAYGLAALIGAVAVKKLGMLALGGVLLLKIWKVGLVALFGGAAALRRFVRGRNPPVAKS